MLEEYEKLARYIERIISDGYQIVIGENVLDWSDTGIPQILGKIKEKREGFGTPTLSPGDMVRNRISGQCMSVINSDGKVVYLHGPSPLGTTVKYPIDGLLYHFEIVEQIEE